MYFAGRGLDTGYPALPTPPCTAPPRPAQRLPVEWSPSTTAAAVAASADLEARRRNLDLRSLVVPHLTRKHIKAKKISPDAFAQLAFQVAWLRTYPDAGVPSVYESASMRHFIDGRTETVRPVTAQSVAAARMFTPDGAAVYTDTERRAAVKAASDAHVQRVRHALAGRGVDRHMFALACVAQEAGGTLPALFRTKAMQRLSAIDLSSSTITAESSEQVGFGPVSADGHGLAYQVEHEFIKVTVTTFNDSARANGAVMTAAVAQAMADVYAAL